MKRLLIAALFVVGLFDAAMADGIRAGSVWTNQRGSVMKVASVDSRGRFRGTFTNNADGFSCKGIPYPVSGTNASLQVNFTVNFTKCRSVATWQGNVLGFGMTAPWTLNYYDSSGKPQTMTGFDFFNGT
jgi:hypothetical protein